MKTDHDLSPGQSTLRDAASAFLAAIEATVPRSTVHYAVEGARSAAATLAAQAHTVSTNEEGKC